MKRLSTLYKEWAFQLFPQLAYEDLLKATEALGSKSKVKATIATLREKERNRYIVSNHYFCFIIIIIIDFLK